MENYLFKIMSRDREKRFGTAMEALDAWRKVCRQMGNARRRGNGGPPAQVRMPSEPPAYSMRDDHTEVTAAGNFDAPPLGPPSRRR
jgi:hypothetical protein